MLDAQTGMAPRVCATTLYPACSVQRKYCIIVFWDKQMAHRRVQGMASPSISARMHPTAHMSAAGP